MSSQAVDIDDAPRRTGSKFAFAAGARPLAGFTIERPLGRGGFGEVYFALSDAGKQVALKLIRRNLDIELRGVAHCLNLKHPHLISLYDVRRDDEDNAWVLMEYVAGPSLEAVIEQHAGGLPAAEAADWLRGIGTGVAYLHEHGIVHRDLKPGNVFCDEGLVKLGDYGLSKFISCSRRSGQTESVGTVHYMAPEVANGRYGKEIDIYALGVILYELLTGRVPFEGESMGEVLMKHLTAEPDLSMLAEPLRSVVAKSLAKDPALRYASVGEMLAALPAPAPGSGTYSMRADTPGRQAPPPAAPLPLANMNREPVLAAVGDLWARLLSYWSSANFGTATKVVLVLVGIWILGTAAVTLIRVLFGLTVLYGCYRLVRAVLRHMEGPPAAPPETTKAVTASMPRYPAGRAIDVPTSPPHRPKARHGHWWRRREAASPVLILREPRERVADLAGSLLLSAGMVAALSLVMVLLRGQPMQPEQFAWLAVISTASAWCVLIPAKLWEGTRGDAALRRFTMLVTGLGIGAAAFGLHRLLLVELPFDFVLRPARPDYIPRGFYTESGAPLLYAYLAYFGFLFLAVRWWRQADPLRSTRLSFWSTCSSVFGAWLVNLIWPFPQPWGFMVVATMSIALQLASPWVGPRGRVSRTDGW